MSVLKAIVVPFCCLWLIACGNKGDLFLVPDEITEEQLESVDEALEALEALEQSGGDLPSDTPETDVRDDEKPGNKRKSSESPDS